MHAGGNRLYAYFLLDGWLLKEQNAMLNGVRSIACTKCCHRQVIILDRQKAEFWGFDIFDRRYRRQVPCTKSLAPSRLWAVFKFLLSPNSVMKVFDSEALVWIGTALRQKKAFRSLSWYWYLSLSRNCIIELAIAQLSPKVIHRKTMIRLSDPSLVIRKEYTRIRSASTSLPFPAS